MKIQHLLLLICFLATSADDEREVYQLQPYLRGLSLQNSTVRLNYLKSLDKWETVIPALITAAAAGSHTYALPCSHHLECSFLASRANDAGLLVLPGYDVQWV